MEFLQPHKFFKFHPVTGSPLSKETTGKLVAADSDFPVYIKHSPTALVVLHDGEGNLLLTKRGIDPNKGSWDLAGGFVSLEDSSFEDAAIREVQEELSILVNRTSLKYLTSVTSHYPYRGYLEPIITVAFSAQVPKDTLLVAKDDVVDAKWFSWEEVQGLEIQIEKVMSILHEFKG